MYIMHFSTSSPKVGRQLLNLLGWDKYFDYMEIYPTAKTRHFRELVRFTDQPHYLVQIAE